MIKVYFTSSLWKMIRHKYYNSPKSSTRCNHIYVWNNFACTWAVVKATSFLALKPKSIELSGMLRQPKNRRGDHSLNPVPLHMDGYMDIIRLIGPRPINGEVLWRSSARIRTVIMAGWHLGKVLIRRKRTGPRGP